GLTAAKEGCAEGECGACAIMIARPDAEGGTRWTSINSCLLPAAALDGQEVITAEGLADAEGVHPVQEEMAVRGGCQCGSCTAGGEFGRYRRPATLTEALEILAAEPDVTVVAGATDWGVEVNIKGARAKSVLAIDRLPELRGIRRNGEDIELGAASTLSELERDLAGEIPLLGKLFPQFASRLIRNGATIGGNLGTGSPIGDAPPALLALEAKLVLTSVRGQRIVELNDYFTGYRQTVREADELITATRIPQPLAPLTSFQKIAKRRYDD